MKIINIILILIVSLVYGGVNYLIGVRGCKTLIRLIPILNSQIYWIIFWFVVFSFIVAMLFPERLPFSVNCFLKVVGYYWMAAFLYFLLFLISTSIIKLILKLISPSLKSALFNIDTTFYASIAIIVIVLFLLVYGTINALHPVVKKYELTINKAPVKLKTLKIAFLSDIHIGEIVRGKRISNMINDINRLNPDLVLLGGDTIDDSPKTFIDENMSMEFKRLKAKLGVYAILGNHEYYSDKTALIVKSLSAGGIEILRDKTVKIADSFYLIGREDLDSIRFNINRKPLSELLTDADTSLPIILMDHQPPRSVKDLDNHIDLELCGHTHKGQMFPNDIFTKMLYLIDYGYKKYGNHNIIVSDGYGTWGPPIRIGNKPEIVEITIKFNK